MTQDTATGSITLEWLAVQRKNFNATPVRVLAQNAMVNTEMVKVLTKRELVPSYTHDYSVKVAIEGKATNQQSTGRCWLFAACNMIRLEMMKNHKLADDFELSQTYLFFHDKLERVNFLLENILNTMDEDTDSRLIQHFLNNPLEDGGQYDMFVNIVEKYGLVPKSVYPEVVTTKSSVHLNRMLNKKVREYCCRLRSEYKQTGGNMAQCREMKDTFMTQVYNVLSIHFGPLPTTFSWTFHNKDKAFTRYDNLTPLSFYRTHTGINVNDYISLINDPRNAYNTTYTDLVYGEGVAPAMDKADRLRYKASLMTHAMLFTGCDVPVEGELPTKYRVENSWGDKLGDKGYHIMTADWFKEFVYQIVVHKSQLEDEQVPALTATPSVLPPWDPMGTLA
ncbi:hypothetical protein SARC_03048 [Sphaeroforma arctica JP610]|uniref:bleomycin hydrolase n=1 Tax=Sphaeroforma arctica JP610 TaxID=667725 RepID=A0A0L0G6T7_9EUKA|nr:hypothetical protein SARC_03048 [Sphaeroforma arctica JP610]KNC84735.1 hypothetical protein SARC_03048 [Sphaeroforma arctica JP610]|eukprot:XP_014158637.1 hypothetical protein SARC_03048 [Sphaeroforma arctica JP610]